MGSGYHGHASSRMRGSRNAVEATDGVHLSQARRGMNPGASLTHLRCRGAAPSHEPSERRVVMRTQAIIKLLEGFMATEQKRQFTRRLPI